MNSNELKELVKQHFSLTDVSTEETTTTEAFGELKDINGAFTLLFDGEELKVGDEVRVRTAEGQELSAPDGDHELEDGKMIKTEGGKVVSITEASTESEDEMKEMTPVEGEIDDKVDFAEEEDKEETMEEEAKPVVEEVVEAVIEAVKEEIVAMKEEIETMKKKMASYEDAPATEKAMPSKMSADKTIKPTAEAFNKDRFEAVMARFK